LNLRGGFDRTIAGMTEAHAKGEPLWRDTEDREPAVPETRLCRRTAQSISSPAGCAPACLDAAGRGARSARSRSARRPADTLYMDVRQDVLPSGATRVSVPMKAYRGRKRGSNVPLDPVHPFPATCAIPPRSRPGSRLCPSA